MKVNKKNIRFFNHIFTTVYYIFYVSIIFYICVLIDNDTYNLWYIIVFHTRFESEFGSQLENCIWKYNGG